MCDDLVDFTDVLPTLAAAAGAELPKGVTLDGRSFLPQVRGETGDPREWIFCHYEPRHGKNTARCATPRTSGGSSTRTASCTTWPRTSTEARPVTADTADAKAARAKLQAVLDRFEKEKPFGK